MSSAASSGNIWCCPCCPAASRRLMLAVGQRVGPMTGDGIRQVGQPRQEGRRRRNDEPCALGSTLAHGVASPPTLPHMPDPPCRAQREASIAAALEREGFSHFRYSTAVLQHIAAVEPSQEAVLATCRQQVQEEKAARERRQGMIAWIAAQQMPSSYQYIMAVLQYERGQCTEAEAQEACRQQQVQDQAQGQRRQEVSQLLEAEGMPADYALAVPALQQYVRSGAGDQQGMLAAARAKHAADQRREALVAALTAEGLATHLHTEPAAQAYIRTGQGSKEAALAACRAKHQRLAQVAARRSKVVALLPDEARQRYHHCEWAEARAPGLAQTAVQHWQLASTCIVQHGVRHLTRSSIAPADAYYCLAVDAYVHRGEGSAQAAAAALEAYFAAHPLYHFYDSEDGYSDF